jgi:hypothetical protein
MWYYLCMAETFHSKSPIEGLSAEETQRRYPFGYFTFPDGKVYGRDPLQEANAGHEVDPSEIDEALRLIDQDHFEEELGLFDFDLT